jgi:hypothetical protein
MEQLSANADLINCAAVPGAWLLEPGRALTLQPKHTGTLRIAWGVVWATLDGPHAGPPHDRGDRLLEAGDRIELRAGQRLVIEPLGAQAPASLTWDPLVRAAAPGRTLVPRPARIIWA